MEMRISFEQKTEKISQFPCANIIFLSPGYCCRRLRRITVFKNICCQTQPTLQCRAVSIRVDYPPNRTLARKQIEVVKLSPINGLSRSNERKCVVANATHLENGTLCLRTNANAFNIA